MTRGKKEEGTSNIPQVSIAVHSKLINLAPNPEPLWTNQLVKHVTQTRIELLVLNTDNLKCLRPVETVNVLRERQLQ